MNNSYYTWKRFLKDFFFLHRNLNTRRGKQTKQLSWLDDPIFPLFRLTLAVFTEGDFCACLAFLAKA